jgi:hypothetical protein
LIFPLTRVTLLLKVEDKTRRPVTVEDKTRSKITVEDKELSNSIREGVK